MTESAIGTAPVWVVVFEPGQLSDYSFAQVGGMEWRYAREDAEAYHESLLLDPDYMECDIALHEERVPANLVSARDSDEITDYLDDRMMGEGKRAEPVAIRYGFGADGPGGLECFESGLGAGGIQEF